MTTLKLGRNVYEVEEGKELKIEDPDNIYGKWLNITTEDFELSATKVSVVHGKDTFIVDKIRFFDGDANKTVSEEIETVEKTDVKKVNLNSLKKAEIVDIAADLGFDISVNRTKKEWIEMIESLSNSEEAF